MCFKAALFLLALVAVSAIDVNFRQCQGDLPVPNRLWSDQCTADVCSLRRGQNFTGRMYFTSNSTFNQLLVDVSGYVFGIPFPLPVPVGFDDACRFLGAGYSCPIHHGGNHTWHAVVPINATLPLVNPIVVEFSLGEHGRTVACAAVDAQIIT